MKSSHQAVTAIESLENPDMEDRVVHPQHQWANRAKFSSSPWLFIEPQDWTSTVTKSNNLKFTYPVIIFRNFIHWHVALFLDLHNLLELADIRLYWRHGSSVFSFSWLGTRNSQLERSITAICSPNEPPWSVIVLMSTVDANCLGDDQKQVFSGWRLVALSSCWLWSWVCLDEVHSFFYRYHYWCAFCIHTYLHLRFCLTESWRIVQLSALRIPGISRMCMCFMYQYKMDTAINNACWLRCKSLQERYASRSSSRL